MAQPTLSHFKRRVARWELFLLMRLFEAILLKMYPVGLLRLCVCVSIDGKQKSCSFHLFIIRNNSIFLFIRQMLLPLHFSKHMNCGRNNSIPSFFISAHCSGLSDGIKRRKEAERILREIRLDMISHLSKSSNESGCGLFSRWFLFFGQKINIKLEDGWRDDEDGESVMFRSVAAMTAIPVTWTIDAWFKHTTLQLRTDKQ